MDKKEDSGNSVVRDPPQNSDGEKQTEQPSNSAEEADITEYEYVTGFKLAVVIVSVTMVAFILMLDTSIIATAIPQITNEFHSLPDVGWYGSAYFLALCALQPLTGKLYTYFSSKRLFLGFLGVFELGSLLCGVATSSNMLIVGRAIAGLGGSGIVNGALTIIAACIPLHKRPVYLGFMMSATQLAIAFGPLIGGALTQYTTWRWCFYINLPAGGAVAVPLLLIRIPDRIVKSETKIALHVKLERLDPIGFVLFAPAAIQFLLALEWGGTRYPWNSATIIGLFCGAASVCGIFLAWEYRQGDSAMIPFSMVRQRIVWSSCLTMLFLMSATVITAYYLPIYFQAVRNATPTLSGVYNLPAILSSMLSAIISGVLVGRLGYYLPWSICGAILLSIGSGLISTFNPETPTGTWIAYQIIAGFGRGCGLQMPLVAIQNTLPQEQTPVGTSLVVFSQNLGSAMFLTFAQVVLNKGLVAAIPVFAPEVDARIVIKAGATAFRGVVPETAIAGVIQAYSRAISHVFYLTAGTGVATFVICWGMGWKSVKKVDTVTPEA